jgi:hypothetical protein
LLKDRSHVERPFVEKQSPAVDAHAPQSEIGRHHVSGREADRGVDESRSIR